MNWERQSTLLIEGLKKKGMTQTDLARELFKVKKPTPGSTQIINNWRRNKQGITIRRVKEVCEIVGIDFETMVDAMVEDYREKIRMENVKEFSFPDVSERARQANGENESTAT